MPGLPSLTQSRALARAVACARAQPQAVLLGVLAFHLAVWTLLPLVLSSNLQLDLVEDLALGKEWQLGYWKHPPLPWWTADLIFRLTGQTSAVYVLGALSAVVCFYALWLLGRDLVGGFRALLPVLALEGVHFYNYSVPKFAHDQMQLPFWALTGLFFCRAVLRGRNGDWVLAGVILALCFWSKYAAYAAVVLALSLALFLFVDPEGRRRLATPGPWLMAAVFLLAIAPNLWWLVQSDFAPLRYVDARAKAVAHWYQWVLFPLQWTLGQLLFVLPGLALLAVAYAGRPLRAAAPATPEAALARHLVTAMGFGPFVLTTALGLVSGRLPQGMWGYPLWTFAPLAVVLWLGPIEDAARLNRVAAGSLVLLAAFPLIYLGAELFEPFLRDRPKATEFPGRAIAAEVTTAWHARFATPLTYVGGSEFPANNVAVYSRDRPHVIVHGDPNLSPWIDRADLVRRGAVLIYEEGIPLDALRRAFPTMQPQPTIVRARRLWLDNGRHAPVRIGYAFVPPQR